MPYINARDVIPSTLLVQIQEYVDGQLVYIPRKAARRKPWGSKSGSRIKLQQRNRSIRKAFREGCKLTELAKRQYLSEDSIRKIIYADAARSRQPEAKENRSR